jgi:hypothetical protein
MPDLIKLDNLILIARERLTSALDLLDFPRPDVFPEALYRNVWQADAGL